MLVCFSASASERTPVSFIRVCSALKKGSRCAKNWFRWMKYNVFPADNAWNLLNLVLISSMYNAEAYAAIRGNVKIRMWLIDGDVPHRNTLPLWNLYKLLVAEIILGQNR